MIIISETQLKSSIILPSIFFAASLCSLNMIQLSLAQEVDNDSNSWIRGIDMPTPRTEVTAANIDESIYIIGGMDRNGDITDEVEMFNVTSNSWDNDVSPLPIPLHHTVASTFKDKIYVIGGYAGDWIPSNQLFIYDPKINSWTEGSPMPTARGSPNANFVNGTLYVIGGDLHDHSLVQVESYDPQTDQWTGSHAPMPTARHHAASAVVDGNIYVMGGRITGELINVDIIEKYDPTLDKWITSLEPMPSKRSGVVATSLNGFIYTLGGEQIQGTFNENERYDPVNDVWTKEAPMPTARHGLGVTTYDGKIYAIGGGPTPGLTTSANNEIFQPNNQTLETIKHDKK
jgi:N-acetylneuraminic acid mutarotase